MRIVENGILPVGGFKALTVLCWIFVRHGTKLSATDVNHERIHWEQEKELLIVGFYLFYACYFLASLPICLFDKGYGRREGYRNGVWRRAYRTIAFEREAYDNEKDMTYVYNRQRYAWAWQKKKY